MTAPGSQIWALTEFQTKCISPFPLLAPGWCGLITQKETTMRKFETLLLLSPELSADARDGILNDLKAIVEREKGTMEDIDQWGMRDLAYPVHKVMRGFYVRLVYAGPSELVAELERNIRIKDGIFKYMTVRLAEDAEAGEVA